MHTLTLNILVINEIEVYILSYSYRLCELLYYSQFSCYAYVL